MKKRLISTALALCLCISAIPNAYASQAYPPSETGSTAVPVPCADAIVPTYQEAYDALIAMKEVYPDGMTWTNDTPYSDSNPYRWKGGTIDGHNIVAVGCAAFALELSDKAFNDLPARMFSTGAFSFSDVKVGDVLRINNDAHTMIVIQVSDTGVLIAEGNNGGKVCWGRSLTRDEVEACSHYITRYPEGYVDPDDPNANLPVEGGSGTLDGGLTWTLTNAGTLTISGSGAMPDFSGPSEQPWNAYADKILKIVVGDGVTSIGSSAFYNCKALSVTLPNSVTAIGAHAFNGSSLISVTIPASVKTIGDDAFRNCSNLASASIPEGVEAIGERAFRGCQKLDSIALPASIETVGAGAFYDCTELKSAVFAPSGKQVKVGDDLFARCWNLNTVTLPQKMDRVSKGMFQNCYYALSSLSIPQGTDSIGDSAFASCSSLTAITIPDSVTAIGTAAFSSCSALKDIYFGGSEAQWNSIGKPADVNAALENVTIHFNSSGTGTGPEEPAPGHTHSWAEAWSSDAAYHWHNCTASGCTVTGSSQKDGYASHVYDSSTDATCNVCGYTRSISGSGSGSGISSTTSTTKNPDGSTTTRTENNNTGTVVETTKYKDGSQTVVETRTDGTVITAKTDPDGSKTETVDQPDGSSVTTVSRKDGTTAAVATSASGQTEAKVTLSPAAVSEARRSGDAVVLPIQEIEAAQTTANAPAVTVKTDSAELVKVEIPTRNVTPGTVAVMVGADGSETVVKTSVPTENGVAVSLPDGATVKIVDNARSFTDVSASYWANDAVAFVSARELFAGTTASAFSPKDPMTRAMLMTVLARYDGEDTSGGAVWYEKGMNWAVANAISDGSDPNGNITREQFVTMLWRYSGTPASSGTLSAFTDAEAVSGYAQEAMRWATENGIINGFGDGRLDPGGQATRAEVAAMIMRYSLSCVK